MKPRILGQSLHPFCSPLSTRGKFVSRSWNRHASSSSSSVSSESTPPKQQLWVKLAVVGVAAAGIGAYIRKSQQDGPSALNPFAFTKYTLIAKEPVSSTGSIFTLKPSKPDLNSTVYEAAWQTGVWSVMFKQPQLQIGRDYTPLPATTADNQDEEVLRFFIRKDAFGEMSRYLHGLGIGSLVEMRGPKIEYKIPKQTQEILFIAGGTGIAPALQAGHTLLRRTDETRKPRIHILWANRRREDCAGGVNDTSAKPQKTRRFWFFGPRAPASPSSVPDVQKHTAAQSLVVRELEALKSQYPGQVTVDYFVDEEKTFIKKKDILDFTNITPTNGSRLPKNRMILISGPEGFISYMAGPKLWAQGTEVQGPLRGIISELDLKDWATWKL